MARRIFKYPLKDSGQTVVKMPGIVSTLSVQYQDQRLMLWAIVDDGDEPTDHYFYTFMTGEKLERSYKLGEFIGTAMTPNQRYVVHVFSQRFK